MSGLIGSILATTNALKANQTAIEVAGRNMANVNNTSYSRQRVEFGISGGISESVITQQRDAIIDSKIVSETSVTGSLESQSKVYAQLQMILGVSITGDVTSADTLGGSTTSESDTSGISTALDNFFNSMQALSANPDDTAAKATVIAYAEELCNQFNSLATDLENLDGDVVDAVNGELDSVNSLLDDIATINGQIAKLEITDPGGALEFRDLRQQKLKELAQYIDFSTEEISNGQIRVSVQDKGGNEVLLVDKSVVSNRLRFNEDTNELYFSGYTTQPMGNSPNSTSFDIEGGSLQGYIYSRSTTDPFGGATSYAVGPLAKMREDLDTLARELATQVSGIYDNAGANEFFFDDDANADAIDLTNVSAKNIQLYGGNGTTIPALSSTTLKSTDTGNAGANEIAMAIAELADFKSSNLDGTTFTGFVSEMATDIGFSLSNVNSQIESQELIMSQLEEQRSSVSGVSIDEELANIIRFQRSFQASARVLKVMDELLETVVNGLVR